MKGILLAAARRTLACLAAATIVAAAALHSLGSIGLIGALFAGYAAGAAWVISLAWRTWAVAGHSASGARRIMLWGLFLRLAILFTVLFAAVHISRAVFGAVAAGFLVLYAAWVTSLALASRSSQ